MIAVWICPPVKLQPESRAEKTLPTALQGAAHALQHGLGHPPQGVAKWCARFIQVLSKSEPCR